ncbi:MAG: hypothetical protein R6X13_02060 [bacterium]
MSELTAGIGQGWVYVWYAVVFTLLVTVLEPRGLAGQMGEFRGYLFYFTAFFALLLALPVLRVVLSAPDPAAQLAAWGLTAGRLRTGLLTLAAAVPIVAGILFFAARDPHVAATYPFARGALASSGRFLRYELAYLLLYYTAWEFCFRGVLFLPLVPAVGLVPALGIQTALSTVYHIGHPRSEILLSLGGGLLLGVVAYLTGSVLYATLMHAAVGIGVDCIQWRRSRPIILA